MEQDRLRQLAGLNQQPDPEVMIDGFGGVPLSHAIKMIQQDAAKLDPNNLKKSDLLMIRNAATAVTDLLDETESLK